MAKFFILFLLFFGIVSGSDTALEKRIKISETAVVGQRVGWAVEPIPENVDRANFYFVFPEGESRAEKILSVNERTGEIRLQKALDHEIEKELVFIAIPTDGSPSHKVIIEVEDANDNEPIFPVHNVQLEISEQARLDTELPLPLANDADSPPFNVQKYRIASGNVNNVFRLSTKRLNGQLYADLVVNGNLDREYRERYDLLIEAIDGGNPQKIGQLKVQCRILDANDNAPEFDSPRYSVQVASNATLGQTIATISAKDADDGENARISYSIKHTNYEDVYYYQIDSETGQISVAIAPLPTGTTHELLVTARDNGFQPLQSSVFLTINIMDEHLADQSIEGLQLNWLTENGQPWLAENLTIGYLVARLELGADYADKKLTLSGCSSLCLKETDSPLIYLLMVCGKFDRELQASYRLLFTLTDSNNQQLFQHPVHIDIEDLNDNAPEWSQPLFKLTFNRSYDDEISQRTVAKLMAHDKDNGENAHIRYSVHGTNLFQINPETGVLSTTEPLNCSVGSEIHFRVMAEDNGHPKLSSSVDVQIDLVDSNAQAPFFEKSLYEVSLKEDAEIGTCLVQVKAFHRGCGIRDSSQIVYSLQVGEHDDEEHLTRVFRLDPDSGRLCLGGKVDFERRTRYQLTILARGKLDSKTSSALVDVHIEDVNDHAPQFHPEKYYLSIRENQQYIGPILSVFATDDDRGDFGTLDYFIEETTNDVAKFRLGQDKTAGQLYLDRPIKGLINQSINEIQIRVNAKDGGGLTATVPATIHIYLESDDNESCLAFLNSPYEFSATEDILPGIIVGTVKTDPLAPTTRRLEILAGDSEERFRLDSKSGRLLVAKELDADHQSIYWLSVKGSLKLSDGTECVNYTQIRINIQDINDNSPRFDMSSVEASILEDHPIHDPFFAVQAIDKDRNENGRVTYELISSDPPCPVIVRPLSGQLLLAAPLDFEQVQQYKLRIRAQDQGVPPRSATINVTLNVFDVNDNAPEFSSTIYNAEISEDASLMTEVLKVSAKDRDSDLNARIRYQLAMENNDFGINSGTGEIFVQRGLDRERQSEYRFVVVATDQGTPSLSSNVSVIIRIGDVNDNTPNCSTIQRLRLNEQQNNHRQLIGVLNAIDADSGVNGTVTYRLQKHHELFDLKPTGELYLRRKIQQLKDSYRLSVIAEDQGPQSRSAVCQVLIKVEKSPSEIVIQEPLERIVQFDDSCGAGCPLIRLNASNVKRWSLQEDQKSAKFFEITDNGLLKLSKNMDIKNSDMFRKPETLTINLFDAYEQSKQLNLSMKRTSRRMSNASMIVHVSEKSFPGQRLTSVSSKSDGSNYWALNQEDPDFEIDSISGALYLRSRLNYTAQTMHTLKVTKYSSQGIALNETILIVDVEQDNMNAPKFEQLIYKLSISESTPVGSILTQIEAFDADEGLNGSITYRIIGDNSIFEVEPNTGEITLTQQLQYHLKSKHVFVLEATDQASNPNEKRSSSCAVLVNVIDTNDNSPIFLSPSSITFMSDLLPTNQPIHYFVAKDVDSGDFGRVQYKIVNGNQPAMFVLDSQTGALTVLHRPTIPFIQLTIRASDSDPIMPRFTEQLFTIQVQENESKWTYFTQPVYEFTLAANTISDTLLVDFKRPSFEISAQPKFKLLPQTIGDFKVDEYNGVLKTNTDVLKYGTYRMTVHVSDPNQKLSDVATILINVPEHKQYGPKLSPSSCNEVWARENEPISRLTRVIATVNNRESSELSYQIEGGSGVEFFSINSTTGVISAKPLDREQISQHILVVSASDNSVPRKVDVCTVKIKVLDLNDNAPEFTEQSPSYLQITDDQQIGMVVAKFEATDKDEGPNGQVIYKLTVDESGIFDINPESGELFLARDLPILANQWEIVVVAEDLGFQRVLHAERRVRIQWTRQKSKISKLTKLEFLRENQTVVLAEGQSRGKFVIQLDTTAKFMDNGKVVYEILSGNTNGAFELDEMGVLKTGKELDTETQPRYELKIQATMNGNRKAIAHLVIRVLNTNDNAPSFPHILGRRIEEDTPVGSLITTISARDSDIGASGQVEYSLTAPSEYFELQRATGNLFLLKSLDFETMPEYLLSIQAFDGEYSTFSTIKIEVIDINDNAPSFTTDLFEFSALPTLRLPAEIGQVTAIDADTEEFGRLEYTLIDGDGSVKINTNTGIVTLIRPLKENEEKFVTVQAFDHGTPHLTAISTIKVSSVPKLARDVPQFANQNYSFMVSEDFPLHLSFGNLSIKNNTPSIACRFQIEDAETSRQFEIDSNGQISIRRALDFETHQVYKTRVSVRNYFATAVNVATTNVALLTIKVIDVNDNEPKFTKESRELIIRVNEKTRRGARLATLEATDADSSESTNLSYSLLPVGDNLIQNSFKIHASSGILHFERLQDEMLLNSLTGNDVNLTKLDRKLVAVVEDITGKWDLAEIRVEFDLESWSGTAPFFPLPTYRKFVLETATNGSILLKAKATNKLGVEGAEWTYGVINNDEIFKINPKSGEIRLHGQFDYEKRTEYEFNLTVTDQRQRSAVAPVFISVIGVDEYAPIFNKPAYTFKVPWSAKPGQQIGRVFATDLDHGLDGRIIYTIAIQANRTKPDTLIGIDPQTGILLLRSSLSPQKINQTDSVELEVVASSSPTQFSRASIYIEFSDEAVAFVNDLSQTSNSSKLTKLFLAGLIISLGLIAVVFFWICLRFCTAARQRRRKPKKQVYSVARGNIAVKTNVERLSPTYANYAARSTSRFSSPTTLAANSLLSSSGMSASSPSNEETEPRQACPLDSVKIRNAEKHRMVMSRSQPDSGIDIDALSIGSINEYLNQISARSTLKFGDSVNAEILNTSATQDSLRASSHASSGIYDFPMRPTIRPLQLKKNLNSSYVFTTRTFTET